MATSLRTEGEVMDALRQRFGEPSWALFAGVANGTGSRARRWADAIAMSVWPSRGLEIHGFEVKTRRSDWLRELKNPKKADAVATYCDRWWIAAGNKDVVKVDELPPEWGLLIPHGKTMKIVKDAPKRDPKPLDRTFVASILRRAAEHYDEDRIRNDAVAELRASLREEVERSVAQDTEYRIERAQADARAARDELTAVQRQLQVAAERQYDARTIGRAIDLLSRLEGWGGAQKRLKRAIQTLEHVPDHLGTVKSTLQEVLTTIGGQEE